jgi:hypothetical protein
LFAAALQESFLVAQRPSHLTEEFVVNELGNGMSFRGLPRELAQVAYDICVKSDKTLAELGTMLAKIAEKAN